MSETESTVVKPTYREIPLALLKESAWNPRKHFDQATLAELATSIVQKGVIEPIVVRPIAGSDRFEIIAGARRYRASKLAGLTVVPAIVRDLDDVAALELAVIENGQRDDVHPLDEAAGFEALQQADAAFTPAVIAVKVGKSESFVYRRLKLLQLVPDVARAFGADAMTAAHAEHLARLSPDLQQRAFDDVLYSPMFQWTDEEDKKPLDERIPNRSALRPLADLDAFIQKHSALDPDSEDARQYFPELEQDIQESVESESSEMADGSKPAVLLQLSTSHFVRQELGLPKNAPAPLPVGKWHEITSNRDRCKNVVAGAIVHGDAYRALTVCATKGCPKHFPVQKKAAAGAASKDDQVEDARPSWEEQERQREAERREWADLLKHVGPAFAVRTAGTKFSAALIKTVCDDYEIDRVAEVFGVKLSDKTAAQVFLLTSIAVHSRQDFLRDVKPFKFNIGAIEQKLKAAAKKAAAKPARATSAKSTKKTKKGKAA